MKDFFINLSERLVKAIELDFTNIKKMIGKEKIYAVSLVTDSDTVSLFLAVNTNEFLEKKNDEKDMQDNELLAQFAEYFPGKIDELDNITYNTKWIPAEWGYSNNDLIHSEIALIVPKLFEKGTTIDSQELALFQRLFFECLTSTLQTLITKGVFSVNTITIFISISDDERTEEIENVSAKILNSEEVYNKFSQR
ncbi:hypothetical protein AMS59_01900 [Lysinibacillus sp. FJAT-14745]|uniref:DUF4303 domain-containing protein n=1 Tax=Lysinibacillus sp. FJAT-14745 TaxID=1704289 RepID=UPI0006AB944A|nr:DUF4303 domain-containing protein [Lysinibacillus sp. FJAT-14745]KOP80180.1 hypothetical protein AMS59_01900 [Lysinibacillus sp. FJAT-14745]